ncbi:protein mab-21-like 2 [Biomphalaria pfeifferi]|uniref:Protein mab-21-like 2 n=1 Tax=Biomphalaria pfeifferi TaxID=112525 RepID=A0AAD8F1P9_BIOPF|nr:protein mab-21-like 2 [Biomphalaria pfeifferi]
MEELNLALHRFHQNIVEPSVHLCRDTIAFCMTQVILPLMKKVGELDARFKCAFPMPNEAYFEGMKTTSVDEFELTVILTNLLPMKVFEDVGYQNSNFQCYGHVIAHKAPHHLGDVVLESGTSQGLVSAHRIREMFAQLVIQAASVLPVLGIKIDVVYREPYTVVKILRSPDLFFFELVPAFLFEQQWPSSAASWPEATNEWLTDLDASFVKEMGFYALAAPCPANPADPSLFRISFSRAEKYLLRKVPQPNPDLPPVSRKDSEKILRIIREADKDDFGLVSSYHIKTVLLHQCMRWPDPMEWLPEKLTERFLELFRDLILSLDRKELPHFFIRNCNLLRLYPPEQLNTAAAKLKAIYEEIILAPSKSIRLSVD